MKKFFVTLIAILLTLLLCACRQETAYAEAKQLLEEGNHSAAIAAFSALGDYKDSKYLISQAEKDQEYAAALALLDKGDYVQAYEAFGVLGDYKEAAEYRSRFKKVQITEKNWKEYLHVEEVVEPIKDATGNYAMIAFSYYMKYNEDVAGKFYAPHEFISYRASAFCNERELVIDPVTGEFETLLTKNCLEYTKNWNVLGLKEVEGGFLLAEAVRHAADYDENGAPIYIYNLLIGFNFQDLNLVVYLYQ